uniref:Uncharacterized protein n=1 Tax=Anguilla anguilla TaxID=7936 RepID=A0A0E9W6F9_ANGAN
MLLTVTRSNLTKQSTPHTRATALQWF